MLASSANGSAKPMRKSARRSLLLLVVWLVAGLTLAALGHYVVSAFYVNLGNVSLQKSVGQYIEYAAEGPLESFAEVPESLRLDDARAAIEYFQGSLTWSSSDSRAARQMGLISYYAGEYGEAERYLLDSLNANHTPMALFFLGNVYHRMGRDEQAIRAWAAAGAARYFVHTADKLAEESKWNEAASVYDLAISIQPHWRPYAGLGDVMYATGRTSEGIAAYRRAVELNAVNRYLRWRVAHGLIQEGSYDEAFSILRHAESDDYFAHGLLGEIYLRKDLLDQAITEYSWALSGTPENKWFRMGLGTAYFRAGQACKALVQWEQVLRIDPDFVQAREALERYQDHCPNSEREP